MVDINLAKLAARGISMVVSSGDSGAGLPLDMGCSPNDTHAMTKDVEVIPCPCSPSNLRPQTCVHRDRDRHPAQVTSGVVLAQAASYAPETCCMAFHSFHPNAVGWTFVPAGTGTMGKCTFYSEVLVSPAPQP